MVRLGLDSDFENLVKMSRRFLAAKERKERKKSITSFFFFAAFAFFYGKFQICLASVVFPK